MEKRRIFSAIDISYEVRAAADAYIDRLRREFPADRVKWERTEKLHVTISFAGYLDVDELEAFASVHSSAARETRPFEIMAAGTGAFVRRGRPGVLWLGLRSEETGEGHSCLEQLAVRVGSGNVAEQGKRLFKPHLTIARVKDTRRTISLIEWHKASDFGPVVFVASEIVIYESTLLPSGSVYRPLYRFPFSA